MLEPPLGKVKPMSERSFWTVLCVILFFAIPIAFVTTYSDEAQGNKRLKGL